MTRQGRPTPPVRTMIRLSAPAALAAALLTVLAPPAAALNCGSAGQPACQEDPPPGEVLELSAAENPYGIAPLSGAPSPDRPLWPRVRGFKPYGFNAAGAGHHGTTVDDEAELHRQAGASLARVAIDWAMVQYQPKDGSWQRSWDFETHVDPKYRAYVARGVRPVFMILRTPRRFTRHATSKAGTNVQGCGTNDACYNAPRADALDRLAAFAREVALRYPLAGGIELWNEPNLTNPFWGGDPADPEHYTAMLRTVHDAVKAQRPELPVIGGSLAGYTSTTKDSWGFEKMSMSTFLARMLQAGAAEWMDGLSYHPYLGAYPTWTSDPNRRKAILWEALVRPHQTVKDVYASMGVPLDERIVPTEFGASTTAGWSEADQSQWLTWQFHMWDLNYSGVPLSERTDAAFAHMATEDPDAPSASAVGYGWTRNKDAQGRFATKQVYCAFRTTFGGYADCPAHIAPGTVAHLSAPQATASTVRLAPALTQRSARSARARCGRARSKAARRRCTRARAVPSRRRPATRPARRTAALPSVAAAVPGAAATSGASR